MRAKFIRKEKEITKKGKGKFSSGKILNQYRNATVKEYHARIRAYNEMVREIVDEFFGNFSASKLNNSDKTYQYPTLNRHQVFKTDKTDFLTEA